MATVQADLDTMQLKEAGVIVGNSKQQMNNVVEYGEVQVTHAV